MHFELSARSMKNDVNIGLDMLQALKFFEENRLVDTIECEDRKPCKQNMRDSHEPESEVTTLAATIELFCDDADCAS